jgi:cation:H+ antiporter
MLVVFYCILGLGLLYYGADFLVKGGADIALKMKVPPLVIGLTLVAYGTSAPEFVVSVDAAIKGLGDVSLGNIVGSNTCNIALILGLCAVITPLQVNPKLLKFDVGIMIAAAAVLLGFYVLNCGVNRLEAVFLLLGCIMYTVWNFYASRNDEKDQTEMPKPKYSIWVSIFMVTGGLAALICGARLLVNSSMTLAHWCGISEAVIGLTVVAVGTSLPELATSVVAAIKKEQDIAIGNVVGSNIFNILGILGVAPLFNPIKAQGISYVDMLLMLGVSLFLDLIMKSGMKISRKEGGVLLLIYALYTVYLVVA